MLHRYKLQISLIYLTVTLILSLLIVKTQSLPSTPRELQSGQPNCPKLENCLSCNKDQIECLQCLTNYFVTVLGKCQACQNGCSKCSNPSNCEECERFYTIPANESVCKFDTGLIMLIGFILLFVLLGLGFTLHYCRLKCKNRKKEKEAKNKLWLSKNDPRLTPKVTCKNSRKETGYLSKVSGQSAGNFGSQVSQRTEENQGSLVEARYQNMGTLNMDILEEEKMME